MENNVVYDRLDDVLSAIEYNGVGISELLGKGTVKSAQRGYGQHSFTVNAVTNIPISKVDPEKALLFHDELVSANGKKLEGGLIKISDDGTSIELVSGSNTFSPTITLSWQVTELY